MMTKIRMQLPIQQFKAEHSYTVRALRWMGGTQSRTG